MKESQNPRKGEMEEGYLKFIGDRLGRREKAKRSKE